MRGLRRPRGATIQREIENLQRAFPRQYLTIYRETPSWGTKGQRTPGAGAQTVIYRGAMTVIPGGGTISVFGAGQLERKDPTLLIVGGRDIRQGDFVQLDGRVYAVEIPIDHFGYFVEARLTQVRQS